MRHGILLDAILWDMDAARAMQIMNCESVRNGHVMRYASSVEDEKTTSKYIELERNLEQWQSEQQ